MEQTYPCIKFAGGDDTKLFLDVALEQGNDLLGVKTHLDSSFSLRQLQNPETCPRFLVVARNPKNTLVSYYNFHRSLSPINGFGKPFTVFFEMFKHDAWKYGNSIDCAASWWTYRDHTRVQFFQLWRYVEGSYVKHIRNCFIDWLFNDERRSFMYQNKDFVFRRENERYRYCIL